MALALDTGEALFEAWPIPREGVEMMVAASTPLRNQRGDATSPASLTIPETVIPRFEE
jgi:hypothetical protein